MAWTSKLGQLSLLGLNIAAPLGAARWAASGSGLLRTAALGLDAYGLYQSASAVGSGAGKLSAGDGWGAVEMGLGLLGVKPGVSGVMRGGSSFASSVRAIGGARMDPSTRLARDEIEYIKKTFTKLGGDVSKLRFNRGPYTGFDDRSGLLYIRGDILPLEGALHPRSAMSIRAVLAHELGHQAHRGTKVAEGQWNDEFRAAYWAVKNLNLPKQDQVHLIQDAIERAREANKQIKLNPLMREILGL